MKPPEPSSQGALAALHRDLVPRLWTRRVGAVLLVLFVVLGIAWLALAFGLLFHPAAGVLWLLACVLAYSLLPRVPEPVFVAVVGGGTALATVALLGGIFALDPQPGVPTDRLAVQRLQLLLPPLPLLAGLRFHIAAVKLLWRGESGNDLTYPPI